MNKMIQKVNQNLYYFAYGLFLIGFVVVGCTELLDWNVTNFIYKIIRIIATVSMLYLTGLNFLNTKDKKYIIRKFLILSVMSLILLAAYKRSEVKYFLTWFLFTVPAEGKSVKKIINTAWVCLTASFSFVVLLALTGIIPNRFWEDKGLCLGFYHPNSVGAYGTTIICLWMIKRYEKFSLYDVGGISLLVLAIYYFTKCKTIIISAVFMIFLVVLFKIGEKNGKINECVKWGVRLLFPVCIGASLAISYLYDGESAIMALLNKVLTGRFWAASLFVEKYSVTLFGQSVLIDLPLDNVYVRTWLECGIIAFVMVWGLYYITMNKLFARKEYALTIACCVYALYGISECYVDLVGYNFTLLLIAQLFPMIGAQTNNFNKTKSLDEQEL